MAKIVKKRLSPPLYIPINWVWVENLLYIGITCHVWRIAP